MLIKSFASDRRGSVLPIFGLMFALAVGAVGAAVDYSRAAAARTELQAVLDAVALMLSKEAINLDTATLNKRADSYVRAMFNRPEAQGLVVKPTFVTDNNTFKVSLSGSAAIDTTFTRVFGVTTMKIATTSQVDWEMRRLELALALDNTGSMASKSKMTELKKAVRNLLKTLKEAARTPDHIKVAIVPFDTVVNVGTENVDANWLTLIDGATKGTWQGCIADRDQPYDTQNTSASSMATIYPATKCTDGSSLAKIRPMTNDWGALDQTIEAMAPNGTTNVTIGLSWAWQALTPGGTLSTAAPPKSDLDKVLVLLTDGTNTKNRWTNTSSLIDSRTKAACENAKGTGVKVYTIRVIEGNAELLRECASSTSMFYDVADATQLNGVFASIAKNLANIRISK
jgi:Mg-chelatase subunit ChlD